MFLLLSMYCGRHSSNRVHGEHVRQPLVALKAPPASSNPVPPVYPLPLLDAARQPVRLPVPPRPLSYGTHCNQNVPPSCDSSNEPKPRNHRYEARKRVPRQNEAAIRNSSSFNNSKHDKRTRPHLPPLPNGWTQSGSPTKSKGRDSPLSYTWSSPNRMAAEGSIISRHKRRRSPPIAEVGRDLGEAQKSTTRHRPESDWSDSSCSSGSGSSRSDSAGQRRHRKLTSATRTRRISQRESPTSLGSPPTIQFDLSTSPTPAKQLLSHVSAMTDLPEATSVASLSTAVASVIPVAVSAIGLQATDSNATQLAKAQVSTAKPFTEPTVDTSSPKLVGSVEVSRRAEDAEISRRTPAFSTANMDILSLLNSHGAATGSVQKRNSMADSIGDDRQCTPLQDQMEPRLCTSVPQPYMDSTSGRPALIGPSTASVFQPMYIEPLDVVDLAVRSNVVQPISSVVSRVLQLMRDSPLFTGQERIIEIERTSTPHNVFFNTVIAQAVEATVSQIATEGLFGRQLLHVVTLPAPSDRVSAPDAPVPVASQEFTTSQMTVDRPEGDLTEWELTTPLAIGMPQREMPVISPMTSLPLDLVGGDDISYIPAVPNSLFEEALPEVCSPASNEMLHVTEDRTRQTQSIAAKANLQASCAVAASLTSVTLQQPIIVQGPQCAARQHHQEMSDDERKKSCANPKIRIVKKSANSSRPPAASSDVENTARHQPIRETLDSANKLELADINTPIEQITTLQRVLDQPHKSSTSARRWSDESLEKTSKSGPDDLDHQMLVGLSKENIRRLKDKYAHRRRRSAQKAAEEAAQTDENKALIKRIEQLEALIADRHFAGRGSKNRVAEDDGAGSESDQNDQTSDETDCK